MNIEKRKISELRHADYNPRKTLKPSDDEYLKIKRSIEHFGYVDPIIVNSDNTIIGGHQRATVLGDLKFNEIDCVIVDLSKEDEKALNIALNKIAGVWDMELVKNLLTELNENEYDVSLTGFDMAEFLEDMGDLEKYTKEVKSPQYEITGEKPDFAELCKGDLYYQLINDINLSKVEEEEKEFLRKAATRHFCFNFKNIAEYYAHANEEMQSLMERSALVIIDYKDAIEWGYVTLQADLKEMMDEDNEYDEG